MRCPSMDAWKIVEVIGYRLILRRALFVEHGRWAVRGKWVKVSLWPESGADDRPTKADRTASDRSRTTEGESNAPPLLNRADNHLWKFICFTHPCITERFLTSLSGAVRRPDPRRCPPSQLPGQNVLTGLGLRKRRCPSRVCHSLRVLPRQPLAYTVCLFPCPFSSIRHSAPFERLSFKKN